jgi:hypothetical protein
MHRISVVIAAALLFSSPVFTASKRSTATRQAPAEAPACFDLTVDSIMRGPDLVGYAPTGLRWSGDSQKLYFAPDHSDNLRLKAGKATN